MLSCSIVASAFDNSDSVELAIGQLLDVDLFVGIWCFFHFRCGSLFICVGSVAMFDMRGHALASNCCFFVLCSTKG
jgi:hypothetical protein